MGDEMSRWSEMSREEWERDKDAWRHGGYIGPPWHIATGWERLGAVCWWLVMAVLGSIMFLGAIVAFGMMIEGIADYRTELDRCRRQADTPYEYHLCR